MDAEEHEVDRDDDGSLDVDDGTCDWIIVDEQVGE